MKLTTHVFRLSGPSQHPNSRVWNQLWLINTQLLFFSLGRKKFYDFMIFYFMMQSLCHYRFQESPCGWPNDRYSAFMDGGDGVCLGMEVLQECWRQDALLCSWSCVQRVRTALNSLIQSCSLKLCYQEMTCWVIIIFRDNPHGINLCCHT